METNKLSKLSTVSTAHHHHYKNNFIFFNRIYDITVAVFAFLWEFLFHFVYLALRILLASIILAYLIACFFYFELKKLIKIIKNIGTIIIFVSISKRDNP